MSNLTTTLSDILVTQHQSRPLSSQTTVKRTSTRELRSTLDAFLREATEINSTISALLTYLRTIRQPYLSTAVAPPNRSRDWHRSHQTSAFSRTTTPLGDVPEYLTDAQREEIDSETSSLLRSVNGNISNLHDAATLQHDTIKRKLEAKYGRPNTFLWRWAGGGSDAPSDLGKPDAQVAEEGEANTRNLFHEGVLWYLTWRLKTAVSVQQGMVEIRLEREREKRASVLYDERNRNVHLRNNKSPSSPTTTTHTPFNPTGPAATPTSGLGSTSNYDSMDMRGGGDYDPSLTDRAGTAGDTTDGGLELTPEQLQLFEQENSSLMNYYNDTLSQVTQAEKSLVEISSLQSTLVGHLEVQGEMIGQLVTDAERTDENVTKGNKELKRATERSSTARMVFYGTVGICGFLLLWDLAI